MFPLLRTPALTLLTTTITTAVPILLVNGVTSAVAVAASLVATAAMASAPVIPTDIYTLPTSQTTTITMGWEVKIVEYNKENRYNNRPAACQLVNMQLNEFRGGIKGMCMHISSYLCMNVSAHIRRVWVRIKMRPKGLTDLEIKQIINFDWNNSDDEEDEEEELYDSNLEKFIEETMDKVMERGENVEINLIDGIVGEDEHADEEVENVADTENIAECSKEEASEFWKKVAEELNSMGPPQKDITSWKKVWLDWKAYIKRKLAENKIEQRATGGGRNRQHHFNEMEEAVIRLTALETSTNGIENTVSVGLPVAGDSEADIGADVSMTSSSRSPALPRRISSARKPTDTSTAEVLQDHFLLQKEFQEKTIARYSIQEQKLEDICSGLRRLYLAMEKHYDLKNIEVEETHRHNQSMEDLINAKNPIKKQMLLVEQKSLNAISKNN
ncbi:uncharacterized protein LOC129235832 [Anastrepha obliqua]|uniref:uncharacterized protein LOC129235832 n=1 Tax=Anastrepha obliqua TaxID=95512 RepID=UPI0024094391|nr:uncharacterized protein LOC129235832 [Anastrepha obliqua]